MPSLISKNVPFTRLLWAREGQGEALVSSGDAKPRGRWSHPPPGLYVWPASSQGARGERPVALQCT